MSWRVMLAAAGRCARTLSRYPLTAVNLIVLMPVYQLVLPALLLGMSFAVGGRATGMARPTGSSDLLGWLLIGMAVSVVTVGVVTTTSGTIALDRIQGSFEYDWSASPSRVALIAGIAAAGGTLAVGAVLVMSAAGLMLGASFRAGLVLSVPIAAAALPGIMGLAFLTAGLVLRYRRVMAVIETFGYVIVVVSGAAIPLQVLPPVIRYVAYILPNTWAIDLARHAAIASATITAPGLEFFMLGATSLLFAAAGLAYFRRIERRVTSDGSVGYG
jgi:ABC-2 type transport system permease protein